MTTNDMLFRLFLFIGGIGYFVILLFALFGSVKISNFVFVSAFIYTGIGLINQSIKE